MLDKAAVPGLHERSGMVSLDIPEGVLPVVPGGVEDHHITVCFLGSDVDDDTFQRVCDRAQEVAAGHPPVDAIIAGVSSFEPSSSSEGKRPVYAIPVGPVQEQAANLHDLFDDFNQSSHPGYHPHVTLAYIDDGDPLPESPAPTTVAFTHLSVHRGGEVVRFPFASEGVQKGFDPLEGRDDHGRWIGGAGGGWSMDRKAAEDIVGKTRRAGGHSVNPRTGKSPVSGYMVSDKDGGVVMDRRVFYGPNGVEHVQEYGQSHADKWQDPDYYMGSWDDENSGKVFLDVSKNVADRGEAIRLGKQNDQLAVWDVANKEEIGTGASGGLTKAAGGRCCGLSFPHEHTKVSATHEFAKRLAGRGKSLADVNDDGE